MIIVSIGNLKSIVDTRCDVVETFQGFVICTKLLSLLVAENRTATEIVTTFSRALFTTATFCPVHSIFELLLRNIPETLLLIIPLMTALDALVKDAHGFIRGSDLHLQKVRCTVIANGTRRRGPIDMLPGCGPTQNVVHLLRRKHVTIFFRRVRCCYRTRVRTRRAVKILATTAFPDLW
jgi:hypothetical protein